MPLNLKNSLKIASIFIGSVIGAGFTSGQEILQFFTVFREKGIMGLIIAGIIFCLVAISVLDYVYKFKYKNYTEFIVELTGKYTGRLIEIIIMFFWLFSFFIIMAGANALFKEQFGDQSFFGILIFSAACCTALLFNLSGVIAINTIIAPILIIGIGFLGVYVYSFSDVMTYAGQKSELIGNWFSASIVYVSYNSITLIAVMAALLPCITERKEIFIGSVLGAGAICLMALVIYFLTELFYPSVMGAQIPILYVIKKLNISGSTLYSIILLAAMFVSAVTTGFCFINKVSKGLKWRFKVCAVVMCLSALPFAGIGFSNLIRIIYPIFGYISLFQIIIIIMCYILKFNPCKG